MLIEARKGLKTKDRVRVEIGWPEVRAIYALYTAVSAARVARDKNKATSKKLARQLDEAIASTTEVNLMKNRAVVALLVDVERILSGDETSSRATHAALKTTRDLLGKSRKTDRRKKVRL